MMVEVRTPGDARGKPSVLVQRSMATASTTSTWKPTKYSVDCTDQGWAIKRSNSLLVIRTRRMAAMKRAARRKNTKRRGTGKRRRRAES